MLMRRRARFAFLIGFLAVALAAPAANIHTFQQVAISPDGAHVAWVAPAENSAGEVVGGSVILIADPNSPASKVVRISAAPGGAFASEEHVAWSPDSKQITFISDVGTDAQPELFIAQIANGSTRKLTNLKGAFSDPAWSPDGKSIAFLFTENARKADPLLPIPPETGVIAEKIYEQRLAVVDITSGKVTQLSPPGMYVYEFDWSPDSASFALLAAHGAGDAN